MSSDPFDDVFTLEDRYYQEGYKQGEADGLLAGKVEGRSFGMQKGFEKFLESGRLSSKAIVWANRLPKSSGSPEQKSEPSSSKQCALPPLPKNPRLEKNVEMLFALVEPDTLSTANTDEAVQDFDDRLKRAQGKAKVIERMVGGREVAATKSLDI